MTIASEIARLQGVKTDILGAIAEKKVDVPTGAMLADAPDLIRSIKSGINVKIGQGVYPAVKIGNQLWLAKNLDENLGHLGNQYEDFTSTSIIGYYFTSSNIGEVVTINKSNDTGWSCVIVDVKAGDFVKFNAHSGLTPKAYIYVDKSNVLRQIAEPSKGYFNFEIQCDVDGKVYVSDANSYKSFYVQRKNVGSADEWYYNNDEETYKKYGRLYTWNNAIGNLSKLNLTKWRIPTKDDWDILAETCGGLDECGLVLKSTRLRGNNATGFNADGGGHYNNDAKQFYGVSARLRCVSDFSNSATAGDSIQLIIDNNKLIHYSIVKSSFASSIRLVMDLNEDGTIPDSNIVLEDVPATTAEPLALASEPVVEEE